LRLTLAAEAKEKTLKYTTDKRRKEPSARLIFWKRGRKGKGEGGAKMRRAQRDVEIKIMRVTTD
jgi:hypothetical protein